MNHIAAGGTFTYDEIKKLNPEFKQAYIDKIAKDGAEMKIYID